MAYHIDAETKRITLSSGDTMEFVLNIDTNLFDTAVFAVFDPCTGKDLVQKFVEITGGAVIVQLFNCDTKYIPAGRYKWQIRLLSGCHMADGNQVVTDENSRVCSVFKPNAAPDFFISKDGAYV